MKRTRGMTALRWVLVIPAGLAASLFSKLVLWLVWEFGVNELLPVEGTKLEPFVLSLIRAGMAPAAFVLAGTETAPAHKLGTSIVLGTLYSASVIYEGILAGTRTFLAWNALVMAVATLAALGAILAARDDRREE